MLSVWCTHYPRPDPEAGIEGYWTGATLQTIPMGAHLEAVDVALSWYTLWFHVHSSWIQTYLCSSVVHWAQFNMIFEGIQSEGLGMARRRAEKRINIQQSAMVSCV